MAIPTAQTSPREEKGIIYWYENNTFVLGFVLSLKDVETGDKVDFTETDKVVITFYDFKEDIVKQFEFTAEDIVNDTVLLDFDLETSKLFTKGKYRYDIVKNGEYVRTIAHKNLVVVE